MGLALTYLPRFSTCLPLWESTPKSELQDPMFVLPWGEGLRITRFLKRSMSQNHFSCP